MSELVTLAFHIKGANLTFELKLYQNVHYKCPASASHGIENIMAAPNLSSSDEGVGGLGMSFVGQPNRRWRSLKPCRIFSTDLPIFPSSLVTLKTRDKDVVRIWTCIFRTYSQVGQQFFACSLYCQSHLSCCYRFGDSPTWFSFVC